MMMPIGDHDSAVCKGVKHKGATADAGGRLRFASPLVHAEALDRAAALVDHLMLTKVIDAERQQQCQQVSL